MTLHPRSLGPRLRRRLPPQLRRLLRLVKLSASRAAPSVQVPDDLLKDCRLCASRIDLVRRLPAGGVVGEVGTLEGAFARAIIEAASPSALHLMDFDFTRVPRALLEEARVHAHAGDSAETLHAFPDHFFDWLYIDADHSYAGVMRDIKAAAPKVRPGGFLVFNDFAHIDPLLGSYGVHRAVCEFAVEQRWPFRLWSFDPHALYDVALQRPA